jgi:hypothetical protein
MKTLSIPLLVVSGLLSALNLSAQATSPSVFYGPYLQSSAAQFTGDWTRSDGTYRLVLAVDAAGEVTAEYFNPQPIQVESTALVAYEDVLVVKVVLRDLGYPGSTYELQYLPQFRLLVGRYTIPGQEPVEVFFQRSER